MLLLESNADPNPAFRKRMGLRRKARGAWVMKHPFFSAPHAENIVQDLANEQV
jgi:hypothetical protein